MSDCPACGGPCAYPGTPLVDYCDECEQVHHAEPSHEGTFGEGLIYAVVCVDGLTSYYTAERVRPA